MASQIIQRAVAEAIEGYQGGVPVDVCTIARNLGIEIIETPFPENLELSGMLVREGNRTYMAVNQIQSSHRKRFTVAHEIGHFLLDESKTVWIDKRVSFRKEADVGTPANYKLEEVRANRFAAELLMPEDAVSIRFRQSTHDGDDWDEEGPLVALAAEFDVSLQAMLIRLQGLGLLTAPGY